MTPSSPRQFIHQDLRQRSFRRQSLQQVVFADCDLRGCCFQAADLQGATFRSCQTGPTLGRWFIAVLLLGGVAGLMFHAVSSMVLGTMGILPGQPAWPYVVALNSALAIAATSSRLSTMGKAITRVADVCAGMTHGALIGFFYGGSLMGNNPVAALVGAVALGIAGLLIAWRIRTALTTAGILLAGAIAAYGFAWVVWTSASAYLTTGHWSRGILLGLIAIAYVYATLKGLADSWRAAHRSTMTSFRRAHLSDCLFIDTNLRQCDVTDATGRILNPVYLPPN